MPYRAHTRAIPIESAAEAARWLIAMGFGHPLLATLVLIMPAFGYRRSGRPPCEPLDPALRKEYPPLRVGGGTCRLVPN